VQALAAKRDAKTMNQIAYWDAGSPGYRWIELGFEPFKGGPPPAPGRPMALLNVAIYDAMVAAWDAKYAYNRKHPSEIDPALATAVPNPASPSYPSEHAAAAGAASAILSYLFPDNAKTYEALAQEAAQSRVLAGVSFPSDAKAGLDLGRAVAARVIERAKNDGSTAKYTGTPPTGAGVWSGDPMIGVTQGQWKPWVLKSGDQFRPPAPPAYDSEEKLAEIEEIKTLTRTFPITQKALYWHSFDGAYPVWYDWASDRIFEHKLDSNPPRAARVYALMAVAPYDAIIACFDAKYAYWAARPPMLDPEVKTLFPTPSHPSYPAAHGCNTAATAHTLAYLFPNEGKAVEAMADEAGLSRVWAGIHFPSDVEAGLALGRTVADAVIERAKADGADGE
jgi:membrane-associated phospholipid phosphatase